MGDTDCCEQGEGKIVVDEIRWMIRADHPDVLAIERQSPLPHWSDDDLQNSVKSRHTMGNVACIGTGSDRMAIGFVVYHLRPKAIDILNIGVLRDCRRQGVGRQMIARLIDKLHQQRRKSLRIVVGEGNLPAQKFLQASGFTCDQVYRSYFLSGDDGYRFMFELPTA